MHKSPIQTFLKEELYNFDDHYTVPLVGDVGVKTIAVLADNPFEIEVSLYKSVIKSICIGKTV